MDREKRINLEISIVALIFLIRSVVGTYMTAMSEAVTQTTAQGLFPTVLLGIGFAYVARGMIKKNAWGIVGGIVASAGLLTSDILFTMVGYPQPIAEFAVDIFVLLYLAGRKDIFNKSMS